MVFTFWEIIYFDLIKNGVSKLDFNDEKKIGSIEIILDCVIFGLVGLKMFVLGCCGRKVSFGQKVIWIIVEIILV